MVHDQDGQHLKLPDATAAATAESSTARANLQPPTLNESTGAVAAHVLSERSCSGGNKKAACDVVADLQFGKSDKTALLARRGGQGNRPPFSLIALLSFFLFLYVGAEVGFGAWIAVVVLRDGLSGEAGAVRMARWGEEHDDDDLACRSYLAYAITISLSIYDRDCLRGPSYADLSCCSHLRR